MREADDGDAVRRPPCATAGTSSMKPQTANRTSIAHAAQRLKAAAARWGKDATLPNPSARTAALSKLSAAAALLRLEQEARLQGPLALLQKGDPPPSRAWLVEHGYVPGKPATAHQRQRR